MRVLFNTHKGPARRENQDRPFIWRVNNDTFLVAVADGMGGHAAGDRAAEIATEALYDYSDSDSQFIETRFFELLQAADRQIREASAKDHALIGMGTTLTIVVISENIAYWAHVGDSRLYLFREGELVQITDDQTVPGFLLKTGELTKDEAMIHPMRNVLMSCIGCGQFEADTGSFEVIKDDLLLLSTDGLHDTVSEPVMLSILRLNEDLEYKLNALIQAALSAGARDDVTVVAAEL